MHGLDITADTVKHGTDATERSAGEARVWVTPSGWGVVEVTAPDGVTTSAPLPPERMQSFGIEVDDAADASAARAYIPRQVGRAW